MNSCPKCKSTLPDWAQQCQFCGSPVNPTVTREQYYAAPKKSNYAFATAKWVWVMYYVVAGYILLSGLWGTITCVLAIIAANAQSTDNAFAQSSLGALYFMLALGLAAIGVGAGLLLHSEFVRTVSNAYCCLMALGGIFSTFMLMGLPHRDLGTNLLLVRSILDMVFGGLMIYLIFETNDDSGF